MVKLWNPVQPILGNIVDAKEKTFVFRFGTERDKARVLEGQPWHFDKFVWCFNEPNNEGKLTDVSLTHFPLWARVYDLPIAGRTNASNVKRIGDCLGSFISFEVGPNTELDRAIGIRYLHDIRVPLKNGIPIKMKTGKMIEFKVKYERLPLYCYGCGVIGHGEKDCDEGPYEEDDLKFGDWLRASPWKIVKTTREGGGKAARDLSKSFDMMRKEDDEADVSKMIEKLQNIAITLRHKKEGQKKDGDGRMDVAVSRDRGVDDQRGAHPVSGGDGEEGGGNQGLQNVDKELKGEVGSLAKEGGGVNDKPAAGGEVMGVRALRSLVRREAPALVFLCETKLSGREMRGVREKFEGYDGIEVDSVGRSGGLAFMWKREIECSFVSVSVHYMDFHVKTREGTWRVTGFYGWPSVTDRHLSWELLRVLARQSELPWVCIGDFNEILFSTEMKGGSRPQWQMNNFQAAVDDCGAGRAFKFEQIWVGAEGCKEAVTRGVEKGHGELVSVLRECASELHEWKKTNIYKIKKLIEKKRRQIAGTNRGNRRASEVNRRKKLVAEVADLMHQEEIYWRQRSRALWLKDGDRNTKFFHICASERKRKNWIGKLIDGNGVVRHGNEEVARVAKSYFEGLFTSSNPTNFEDALQGLEGRVTREMNLGLERDYCEEEILDALHQMNPLKAPGLDGMNSLFFQSYWSIIGPDVIRTVLQILRGTRSPRDLNKTNIVLIPKKKAPDKIQDYRPISLCNVAYKIVSKVLANRLKIFLDSIVSENQSAFTPGRAISDNVLTAFEMFHYMKSSRSSKGYMAIRLDMAKAYDRVEWCFMKHVLEVMGFDRSWIARVIDCVSTVSFSVLINGTPMKEFQPSRGLRQGDPLSPYLFILCAEALSNLIRRAVVNDSLHGIRISQSAPFVSHLFFADDSKLIFPCLQGCENWVVADLLDDGLEGWNREKLVSALLPFECDRVASIRLSSNRPPDDWYWCAERDGIYSVKSAYYRFAGEAFDMGEPLDWEREKWLWNRLWRVPIWPRIKLFFW
ncbi:uncharacterized protein LOC141629421 [Silene latifolia]|uniref:uncharacterized protein LOC141629421 n=1 Tax=Silene latifolia TaxID=37657 RepID=UPI003D76D571